MSPSGEVAQDQTVTLSVYGDPVTTEQPSKPAKGPGKAKDKKQR